MFLVSWVLFKIEIKTNYFIKCNLTDQVVLFLFPFRTGSLKHKPFHYDALFIQPIIPTKVSHLGLEYNRTFEN